MPEEEEAIKLAEIPDTDPGNYQANWAAIRDTFVSAHTRAALELKLEAEPRGVQTVEGRLEKRRVYCVASGEIEGVLKFYLYAKSESGAEFFVELEIARASKLLHANIKTNKREEEEEFKRIFERIIRQELN